MGSLRFGALVLAHNQEQYISYSLRALAPLRWTPQTCALFYRDPAWRWPRTLKIDPMTLPRVLHTHPYFPDAARDRATHPSDPNVTVSWQE